MWVLLLCVMLGEYEVIVLNDEDKYVYICLDNDCMLNGLYSVFQCYYSVEGVNEEDCFLVVRVLKEYGNFWMDMDVMCCKFYVILLLVYIILGMEEEVVKLVGVMQIMFFFVKVEQLCVFVVVIFYGCMDSSIYYYLVYEVVDLWKKEEKLKKSKQQLINWLVDYDWWLRY